MAPRKRTRSAGGQTARRTTTKPRKPVKNTAKEATRPVAPRAKKPRDARLPAPGTTIVRPYKRRDVRVDVLEDGFRWEGKVYRSLSAPASAITGAKSINGFLWFRLTEATAPKPKTPTKRATKKDVARAE